MSTSSGVRGHRWAGLKQHLVLMRRHDGSQVRSTSLLLSSVSASSFPDGDVLKARIRSLPVSSEVPLAEEEESVHVIVHLFSVSDQNDL